MVQPQGPSSSRDQEQALHTQRCRRLSRELAAGQQLTGSTADQECALHNETNLKLSPFQLSITLAEITIRMCYTIILRDLPLNPNSSSETGISFRFKLATLNEFVN